MARTPHTSAPPGSRVRIVTRKGDVFEAKFVERTGQYVVVLVGGVKKRLKGRDISAFSIAKGQV